jgi:hypothetical protein
MRKLKSQRTHWVDQAILRPGERGRKGGVSFRFLRHARGRLAGLCTYRVSDDEKDPYSDVPFWQLSDLQWVGQVLIISMLREVTPSSSWDEI